MKTVNIHEAKTHLSRLVEAAVEGEPFVIAKAGKPLVKVEKVSAEAPRRTGFLKGQIDIPDDFDRMAEGEIRALFEGSEDGAPENAEDGGPGAAQGRGPADDPGR